MRQVDAGGQDGASALTALLNQLAAVGVCAEDLIASLGLQSRAIFRIKYEIISEKKGRK